MDKLAQILKNVSLFEGFEDKEISSILNCLNGRIEEYKKNTLIFKEGDKIDELGIVLSGDIHLIKNDYFGNENLIAKVTPMELFGEAAACSNLLTLPVTIFAMSNSKILYLKYKKIITTCSNACKFHLKLIENMVTLLADKNLILNNKLDYISKRSIKEKVLSYLNDQSKLNNSKKFKIPFNREHLANYLAVDRSALSNTLSKLRDEKIITYNKNEFNLLI